MYVSGRKEADETVALVSLLSDAGRAGIDKSVLSTRLHLSADRLETLLKRHSEYFVQVGSSSSFALNRFGKFGGSADLIVSDIERSCKAALSSRYALVAVLAAVLASLAAIL